MENPNSSAVWIQLITTAGTILTLIITHLLTRQRQAKDAKEVKADLAVAEKRADVREAKLDDVHLKVAKTEVLVNGDRQAKERRIAELEATLRANGLNLP